MKNIYKNNRLILTKVFLFSLILPFIFSVVRAEKVEDKIAENKEIKEIKSEEQTITEKFTNIVKSIFKTEENKKEEAITEVRAEKRLIASTTKEILENIRKEVKENKNLKKTINRKIKKLNKNSCDIYLSILEKSDLLDDKISTSLLKINNIEKQIGKEFIQRDEIIENIKSKNIKAETKESIKNNQKNAENDLYINLQNAKEFYVEMDDNNIEIVNFVSINLCEKTDPELASEKELEVDKLISKEKIYRKTLTNLLKEIVINLQKEVEKVD